MKYVHSWMEQSACNVSTFVPNKSENADFSHGNTEGARYVYACHKSDLMCVLIYHTEFIKAVQPLDQQGITFVIGE